MRQCTKQMFWKKMSNMFQTVCPSNKISPFRVGNQINRPSKSELNFVWSDSELKLQQNNQISSITSFVLDLPKLWNKLFCKFIWSMKKTVERLDDWKKLTRKLTLHLLCLVMLRSLEETEVISYPQFNLSLDLLTLCRLAEHNIVLLYLVLVNKNLSVINK